MAKKITAILFLIIIFVFGIGTVLKAVPALHDARDLSFDKESITAINSLIDTNVKSRNNWINLNGAFLRGLGITFVDDAGDVDVYKLKNDQLIYGLDKQDMNNYISSITQLHDYCERTGNGSMVYFQLPFKVENDSMMPAGSFEYGNDNADALLKGLHKVCVPYLDIRDEMHKEKIDFGKAFISTDQHWTPETARWAAGRICAYLNRNYGLYYDKTLFEPENWNVKTYKEWFLGSLGKRTGKYYGGVSDFDILTPKADTDFTFFAETQKGTLHRKGDFSKALLSERNIETKDLFNLNPYATYIGGDYKINIVTNKLAENDISVLLVRDSFSCAMQPFLCMNYKKVTAIDLRHYDKGTLEEYLDKNRFDLIMVAYNPSAFSKEQFTFR